MTHRSILAIAAAATLSLSTAAVAGLSLKDDMKQVVEPASNTLFTVGGEVDPANGPDAAKVGAARWREAAEAATKLKMVAASLVTKDEIKPGKEWIGFVRQLNDTASAALKAANARDGGALSAAANDLSDTCSGCHAKYRQQTGD